MTHLSAGTRVLALRERAAVMREVLAGRLETVLPVAMREAGLDMWLVICQEDDLDPVFPTLLPMDCWCPILQMLILHDPGRGPIERLNLSMTHTGELYDRPWTGREHSEQWPLLAQIIAERDPRRIGINTGSIQWAAGGLTHNLYLQLVEAIGPQYASRLQSAEALVTHWLATLTPRQIELFDHVAAVAHGILSDCYSRRVIVPGLTTTDDLEWHYWQTVADLGLQVSFKPFFNLIRSPRAVERFGPGDNTIRSGDVIHSDVGIRYLGLNSDHQQLAYILKPGETDAPAGLRALLSAANRLQDVFMAQFVEGVTGNELLARVLAVAGEAGIPGPRVYSHSLGHLLHEPGPLIGLPWEQERCPGRGDVLLRPGYAFTAELSVTGPVAEWGTEAVCLPVEEDVVFTAEGCRMLDGRQERFHVI